MPSLCKVDSVFNDVTAGVVWKSVRHGNPSG